MTSDYFCARGWAQYEKQEFRHAAAILAKEPTQLEVLPHLGLFSLRPTLDARMQVLTVSSSH